MRSWHKKAEQFCKISNAYDKIDQNTNSVKLPSTTWPFFIRKFFYSRFDVFPKLLSLLLCQCFWPGLRWFRELFFTEKFNLSWSNKQRVSHPIVTNNSSCKTLLAQREHFNTRTGEEDQEAELKPFVWQGVYEKPGPRAKSYISAETWEP